MFISNEVCLNLRFTVFAKETLLTSSNFNAFTILFVFFQRFSHSFNLIEKHPKCSLATGFCLKVLKKIIF